MIQGFCSDKDLLSLTSVNKAGLATRFCNPRLQQLSFRTVKDTEQFLSYCQAIKEEAQALILEKEPKIRTGLKSAFSFRPHNALSPFYPRFASGQRINLNNICSVHS
jgi:hypothetical protein